jgi:hypothetical protein
LPEHLSLVKSPLEEDPDVVSLPDAFSSPESSEPQAVRATLSTAAPVISLTQLFLDRFTG